MYLLGLILGVAKIWLAAALSFDWLIISRMQP